MSKRVTKSELTEGQVIIFYNNIQYIIEEREIRWADLARLIGVSPKTLSSMRSQRVNPSVTTAKKIADALDVSLDELFWEPYKSRELYDLYWTIPRVIQDLTIQSMTCKQMIVMANVTGNTVGTELQPIRHRIDICKEEIHEKIKQLKTEKDEK